MSHEHTFGTVLNCMDGRTQEPVSRWAKEAFGVDVVDTITEPGIDKLVAEGDETTIEHLKNKVLISVEKHGSNNIAIVGHAHCAGNPVSDEDHATHIRRACEVIARWELDLRVAGLWVDTTWTVNVVCDTNA